MNAQKLLPQFWTRTLFVSFAAGCFLILLTGCPGGNVTLLISGTVLEGLGSPPVGTSGVTVNYASGTNEATHTTGGGGTYSGTPNGTWVSGNPINYVAFKDGSVDAVILNTIGITPYTDLQSATFTLTTPDASKVPVTVYAQNSKRDGRSGATVTITDASANVVGTGTTGADGSIPAVSLNQGASYNVAITGMSGTFPISTSPAAGATGTLCRLRVYCRF